MSAPTLVMRALLRLYPADFRARFGAEMCATFADAWRGTPGRAARTVLIARAVIDATQSAAGEWRDHLRNHRPVALMLADWNYALREASRTLRRNPGFATATTLTLAVGIGATTAVFSVMSAALLEPLPYANAKRLAVIEETRRGDVISVAYPNLLDFQARTRAFEAIGGFSGQSFVLTSDGEAERLRGQVVTANLFATLGVQPALGRHFVVPDDEKHAAPVVAISHALWARRFASDSGVIGRSMQLNDIPFTVVAVMPPAFRFPDGMVYGPADVWTPMSQFGAGDRESRDNHAGLVAIGLLRTGISLEQGRADLSAVATSLAAEYPGSNREQNVSVSDPVRSIVGSLEDAVLLLFGAAVLVLLIACANVGGLLLTRADARRREIAIKAALGASGMRVAANLAAEAILLTVAGAVAGIALAFGLVQWIGASIADLPRLSALSIDLPALAFAVGAAVVVAVTCSLLPMGWARAHATARSMQLRGVAGAGTARLRNTFIVGQVALSLMLMVTATLLLRTFERMATADGGIRPDGVSTFTLQFPPARYPDANNGASRATFIQTLVVQLEAHPGISSAAAISLLPFTGGGAQSGIRPVGGTDDETRRTDVAVVTPNYFATMGIDVVRGRTFTDADNADALPVVVVDERFANAMWPGKDPIGQLVEGWGRHEWTVVGVVRHVKNYGVAAESRQEMYAAYAQRPTFRVWTVMRTTMGGAAAIATARAALKEIDPLLPMYNERTMRDVVDATIAGPRLAAFLTTGYALTALLVALIGIHGAISYLVVKRTREIGVRVALGASGRDVVRLVVRHSLTLTAIGVALGLGGSFAIGRVIRDQLFGVAPTDVVTFAVAAALMFAAALLASTIPVWRALRVSPLIALTDD